MAEPDWATSPSAAMKFVATTKATASRAIDLLVNAGVLVETTGKRRDRAFVEKSRAQQRRASRRAGALRWSEHLSFEKTMSRPHASDFVTGLAANGRLHFTLQEAVAALGGSVTGPVRRSSASRRRDTSRCRTAASTSSCRQSSAASAASRPSSSSRS